MASERDLLTNSVQEREYLEIDVKRQFYAAVSSITKWQIASSEVSDEVYALNKEQYITEAESLQSKLTEVYLRLEANIVYKLSNSEKKKREELMDELSYDIEYLSNITPMKTDCNRTDALPNASEQVKIDQLSTALLDKEPTDRSTSSPYSCVSDSFDDVSAATVNTERVCKHEEQATTEVENADLSLTGCNTADIEHTAISTELLVAYTEVPIANKDEPDAYTEDPTHGYTEKLADARTEEPDVYTKNPASYKEEPVTYPEETAAYKKEHAAYKKEPASHTEHTAVYQECYTEHPEQHPRAWPTVKTSTSTNGHSTMKTERMVNKSSTDSNIAEYTDNGVKVRHHPKNREETIETSESMSKGIICCQFDYSNEIRYLLLYS